MLPPKAPGENPSWLFQLLEALGGLGLAPTYDSDSCLCLFTWPSPCVFLLILSLVGTRVIGLRSYLVIPGCSHLESLSYIYEDPFSKQGHIHRHQGLGLGCIIFGGREGFTIPPITLSDLTLFIRPTGCSYLHYVSIWRGCF